MERVSLVKCPYDSKKKAVQEKVWQTIEMLGGLEDRFAHAKKVLIKANVVAYNSQKVYKRLLCLTDPTVLGSVAAWIRKVNPGAAITLVDEFFRPWFDMETGLKRLGYLKPLRRQEVNLVDQPKPGLFESVDGGLMFRRYWLPELLREADAVVSVAHMKAHVGTGFSLSIKNLFGWPPTSKYAHPRRYLHSQVRLPLVLADIGLIVRPALSVVDAMVAVNGDEWVGEPMRMNLLLAGSNSAAVDAVGARLMGLDPEADYPAFPYMFDRNHLLAAARAGLGPVAQGEIEVVGEPLAPNAKRFHVERKRPAEIVEALRRDIARQALFFRDNRARFVDQHRGNLIGLMKDKVLFSIANVADIPTRSTLSPHSTENAIFFVRAVPEEEDWENYEVYERVLSQTE